MRLNNLRPASGAKKRAKRMGRGIGSGFGKTCGRGHKGQKSRCGHAVNVGFEGGQMPLQRRLPKTGFSPSNTSAVAEIRLSELHRLDATVVDMSVLTAANLVSKNVTRAKIIVSGQINKAISVQGVGVTKGARLAIEAAGGKIISEVKDGSGV